MTIKLHYHRHLIGSHNRRDGTEYLVDISFKFVGEVIHNPFCEGIKSCEIEMNDMSPQDETADLLGIS